MDGIKIEVTGNIARVVVRPSRLTAGTVGLPVEFSFDSQWDGLIKTAVFRAGNVSKITENLVTNTIVPWETLEKPGLSLDIGVYGVNADGTEAIATIWANVGVIRDGVSLTKDVSVDSTLPAWKQISNAIGNLPGLTTNAKDNIVEAINEVHSIVLAALAEAGNATEATASGDDIKDITAESIGALPIEGGRLSGSLNVNGGVSIYQTDSEGGNIMIMPPKGKPVNWWEMDSYDGKTFRIFCYRNASNTNGEGHVFPLTLHDDGSISTGNKAKTLERLGAKPATWMPTAEEVGALSSKWIARDAAANGILEDALTISADAADGENNIPKLVVAGTTIGMPANCKMGIRTVEWYSESKAFCRILGVDTSGMPAMWLCQRDTSGAAWTGWQQTDMVTTVDSYPGCYFRQQPNGEIEWLNPPMDLNFEYRTTERWKGRPVYCKVIETTEIPASSGTKRVELGIDYSNVVRYHCFASNVTNIISLPYADSSGNSLTVRILGTGLFFVASSDAFSGYTATLTLYYVK